MLIWKITQMFTEVANLNFWCSSSFCGSSSRGAAQAHRQPTHSSQPIIHPSSCTCPLLPCVWGSKPTLSQAAIKVGNLVWLILRKSFRLLSFKSTFRLQRIGTLFWRVGRAEVFGTETGQISWSDERSSYFKSQWHRKKQGWAAFMLLSRSFGHKKNVLTLRFVPPFWVESSWHTFSSVPPWPDALDDAHWLVRSLNGKIAKGWSVFRTKTEECTQRFLLLLPGISVLFRLLE